MGKQKSAEPALGRVLIVQAQVSRSTSETLAFAWKAVVRAVWHLVVELPQYRDSMEEEMAT
jgi:hypothetical protein